MIIEVMTHQPDLLAFAAGCQPIHEASRQLPEPELIPLLCENNQAKVSQCPDHSNCRLRAAFCMTHQRRQHRSWGPRTPAKGSRPAVCSADYYLTTRRSCVLVINSGSAQIAVGSGPTRHLKLPFCSASDVASPACKRASVRLSGSTCRSNNLGNASGEQDVE